VPTKNKHLRYKHPLTMQACRMRCRYVERGSLHNEIHLFETTRLSERTTFQYRIVFSSYRHLIIFEKLISINECNFMFINIEVVRTITSAMKSSMKILLFQWSQVFKHSEWKHMIDAWFRRFNVTTHPTSKILSALVHGPHRFVLDNHV
jgi:hypothetical protein